MRKLLIFIMMMLVLSVAAETRKIPVEIGKKGNNGHEFGRAPLRNIPIEVNIDDESGVLSISCPESDEGEVYIYDASGVTVDYAPCINTTLCLPADALFPLSLYIESDVWIATGVIEL